MFNCKKFYKLEIRPPSLILLITTSHDRWIFPSQSWEVRNSVIIIIFFTKAALQRNSITWHYDLIQRGADNIMTVLLFLKLWSWRVKSSGMLLHDEWQIVIFSEEPSASIFRLKQSNKSTLHFDPEDGSDRLLRNFSKYLYLLVNTA